MGVTVIEYIKWHILASHKNLIHLCNLLFLFSLHFLQTVTEVLKKAHGGEDIITELSKGALSAKSRRKMVRLLVSELMQVYGER